MQQRQVTAFFLEIIIGVAVIVILSTMALPGISQIVNTGRIEARGKEYEDIRSAVATMLYDSNSGVLEPTGPTADMSLVRTIDKPPLVLSNYLKELGDRTIASGLYLFDADGTVIQMLP